MMLQRQRPTRDLLEASLPPDLPGDELEARRQVLDALIDARHREARAHADRFLLVAEFADHYRAPDPHPTDPHDPAAPRLLHGERRVRPGGDGCPEVAEFASLELGARLGIRPEQAAALISSALTVRHRLPHLWRHVDSLTLPVWVAQKIGAATLELSLADCLAISAQLDPEVSRLRPRALLDLVDALVLDLRTDQAQDEHEQALGQRRVTLWRQTHVTEVQATLDKADAAFLDAQITRIAGILAAAGDADDHEVRRAKALGVLASPARALQLLQASLTDQLPGPDDEDALDTTCPAAGQRGHTCGTVTVDPDLLLPQAHLVVQLTETALAEQAGLASATSTGPGIGPVLAEWVCELLGHARVTVRPVLDVGALAPSSAYQVPPKMREAVLLRNPTSVFPHSTRSSRRLDLDHTTAYDPQGPPGQTRPDNLGPLTRKEHRAKTHGGWEVSQVSPGVFHWRSPLGYRYLVTPSGTLPLDQPPSPRIALGVA